MEQVVVVCLNALLYLSFWIYLRRGGKNHLASFIAAIWSVSAVASIFLLVVFPVSSRVYDDFSVSALLFLFACFSLDVIPMTSFQCPKKFYGNVTLVYIFAWFLCALTALPFIGNAYYFCTHLGVLSSFGSNYGEKVAVLPGFLGTLDMYSKYLRVFLPILLIFFLRSFSKYFYLCICLSLCCLNPIVSNLNVGSRFAFVVDSLYYISVFVMFKGLLSKRMARILKTAFFFGFVIFGIVFLSITIVKVNAGDASLYSSLSLYGGESFLNFSDYMWNNCSYTNGDNAFFVFKYIFDAYPSEHRDFEYLTSRSGLMAMVFYTYIGDFYMDFGPVGAFVCCLFISLVLYGIISAVRRYPSVYMYALMAVFMKILIGGFAYYQYLNLAKEILFAPLVCVFMLVLDLSLQYLKNGKVAVRSRGS